jgi:hypothetical protein
MNQPKKPPLIGISIREFARRDGCSEKLVRRHVERGGLKRFADGTVDPTGIGTGWRESSRGSARAADRLRTPPPKVSAVAKVSAQELSATAEALASVTDGGAYELAILLSEAKMPAADAQALVNAWHLRGRAVAIETLEEMEAPPEELDDWRDHPRFKVNWMEGMRIAWDDVEMAAAV